MGVVFLSLFEACMFWLPDSQVSWTCCFVFASYRTGRSRKRSVGMLTENMPVSLFCSVLWDQKLEIVDMNYNV